MRREQITVTNNSVRNNAENKGLEEKSMKKRLLHFKKRMVPAVSGALPVLQQDSSTMMDMYYSEKIVFGSEDMKGVDFRHTAKNSYLLCYQKKIKKKSEEKYDEK